MKWVFGKTIHYFKIVYSRRKGQQPKATLLVCITMYVYTVFLKMRSNGELTLNLSLTLSNKITVFGLYEKYHNTLSIYYVSKKKIIIIQIRIFLNIYTK